jgi:serine/threonine protein phosphatase PrpC
MKKTNQDSMVIIKNFLGNEDFYLFGVCDGHGEFGHFVSEFVC